MADSPLAPVVRHIHKLFRSAASGEETDAHLLTRYIRRRDEDAFAALVRRHGPLVWRVCRRLLRQTQDAEEAYQATFLVLARRAAKVRKPAAVASYLYGVAYRIALNIRADLLRRQAGRAEPVAEPVADPANEAAWHELERILIAEVHELSEKYRAPILLCYWEGLTNEEASRRLGLPVGTVKTRLLKARQLLHERLTRRGVSLSAGAMVTLLAAGGGDAAVPLHVAIGAIGIPSTAAALAEQAVRGMIRVKIRAAALLLLASGTLALTCYELRELYSPRQAGGNGLPASRGLSTRKPQPRTDHFGDPLPAGAVARLGTRRLCGPMDPMWLRFSPDGSKIAAQGIFVLTVWDSASGKRLVERMHYDPIVNGMAWRKDGSGVAIVRLPDRSYFVSEFTNIDEKLPDPPPGPRPNAVPVPGPDGVESHALSADGTRLAIVRTPEKEKITIDLLAVETGKQVGELKRERTLGPFTGPCAEVRYAAAGRLMILASPKKSVGDWSITIVDTEKNRVIRTARIPPPGFCVWKYMLGLSADARLAAIPLRGTGSTNDHDGTLRIWDLDAGKELRSLPFPRRGYGVGHAFPPDGKRLLTDAEKDFFRMWDLATGKETARSPEQTSTFSKCLAAAAFSPDGKRFATARRDGNIDIWDTQTVKPALTFTTHREKIKSVTVSPDSRLTATMGDDGFVRTWELATGRLVCAIAAPPITKLSEPYWFKPRMPFAPEGRGLLFRAADGLALADPSSGKRLPLPAALRNRQEHLGGFSADGRTLATFRDDKVTLWTWPAASIRVTFSVPLNPQKPAWIKKGPERVEINSVALSIDGRLAFTNSTRRQINPPGGGYQNSNDVWDGRTGKHLHRLTTPETEYPPGVFSPDGSVLYVGGHSLNFRERRTADALTAWNPSTGALLRRISEPKRGATNTLREKIGRTVSALAVSPDGRLLATAEAPPMSSDNIWLYETASGRIIKPLPGHEGQVTDLTFTPDGRRLVTVSDDQTGLIWDVTVLALGAAAPVVAGLSLRLQAWERLTESDPKLGYNAMAALTANPAEAIALLREKLRPAPVPTEADLDRLVGQFDAGAFADRQKALAELERFGPNAVTGIKARLKRSPPLEVRKRLLLFLEKYDGPNPHQLRCVRAVAVLEAMNSTEARALLAKLAKGPPNDVLTHEAQATSRRAGR